MSPLFLAVERAQSRALNFTRRLADIAPLLARFTAGSVFVASGWGKLHNLEHVTGFFEELGIIAPAFNAVFVSATELVGGGLILVGLWTRLAAVPLICTMVVAIATAQASELASIADFFGLVEVAYIALLLWLALCGAGKLSLDQLLAWKAKRTTAIPWRQTPATTHPPSTSTRDPRPHHLEIHHTQTEGNTNHEQQTSHRRHFRFATGRRKPCVCCSRTLRLAQRQVSRGRKACLQGPKHLQGQRGMQERKACLQGPKRLQGARRL